MPTGYTAKLMEEGQTFNEFVTTCARAMGALVMMRDDPMDAPIPERFEPSNYSKKKLAEGVAERMRLEEMGGSERIAFGEAAREAAIFRAKEYLERGRAENERLAAMEAQVVAWLPPSPDHEPFKAFMLQQLDVSKNDPQWPIKTLVDAESKSPVNYYATAAIQCEHDIAYHTKAHAEEVERTEKRNQWIAQLRASLGR